MIAAAVFAACVAGVVVFLGWLDKQVPSLPVGPPPVRKDFLVLTECLLTRPRLTVDVSRLYRFRGELGGGGAGLQVRQLAIVLAGLRGGIIGVYENLFVNIWHRMRGFVAFGIIDGAVTSGVGLALAIFETGTLGEKTIICFELWFVLFKNTVFAMSINMKHA